MEHDHHMDPVYMENMLPWEFEVRVALLMENLKRKADARASQ